MGNMSGLISFAFMVAMTPWRAFVLLKLWMWYLVPVWPALAIPKWNLYGVSIIVGWMTMQVRFDEKTGKNYWINAAALSFVGPLLILFTGWIIKVICL
jgi:hypothetical protein